MSIPSSSTNSIMYFWRNFLSGAGAFTAIFQPLSGQLLESPGSHRQEVGREPSRHLVTHTKKKNCRPQRSLSWTPTCVPAGLRCGVPCVLLASSVAVV